jgi:hypothetical protein
MDLGVLNPFLLSDKAEIAYFVWYMVLFNMAVKRNHETSFAANTL